jgi:hypothetical protein
MTTDATITKTAADVRPGDVLLLASGIALTVTRIDEGFFGRADLRCFVEDSDVRWLAQPMLTTAEVTVRVA